MLHEQLSSPRSWFFKTSLQPSTLNNSIILSSPSTTRICGTALNRIESYLFGRSFQVTWAGTILTGDLGWYSLAHFSSPSLLNPLTLSLLLMGCLTTAIRMTPNPFSPSPSKWHTGFSAHLCLPEWHSELDGQSPSKAQTRQDWIDLHSRSKLSPSWFHHFPRGHQTEANAPCRNLRGWWITDSTSSRTLQRWPGHVTRWPGLKPSQTLPCHTPAHFPPLAATRHGSHTIQNIGASLPSS